MNKILTVSFLLALSGCAATPVMLTGLGVASVATNETTGKSITDHAVSSITRQDCRIARTVRDQPICQDPALTQITVTATGTKPSSTTEIESRYRQ
jgi:predicted regulator of amino acid metabolism with ACT domain